MFLNRLNKFENEAVVFEIPCVVPTTLKPTEYSQVYWKLLPRNAHSVVHITCYNRIPDSGYSMPRGVQVVYTQQPLYAGTLVRMDALTIEYSIRFRTPCLL